jgi:hypothetical protein
MAPVWDNSSNGIRRDVAAAKKAGAAVIAADVREGSRQDVLRYAVWKGAEQHGLSEADVMARVLRRHGQTSPEQPGRGRAPSSRLTALLLVAAPRPRDVDVWSANRFGDQRQPRTVGPGSGPGGREGAGGLVSGPALPALILGRRGFTMSYRQLRSQYHRLRRDLGTPHHDHDHDLSGRGSDRVFASPGESSPVGERVRHRRSGSGMQPSPPLRTEQGAQELRKSALPYQPGCLQGGALADPAAVPSSPARPSRYATRLHRCVRCGVSRR